MVLSEVTMNAHGPHDGVGGGCLRVHSEVVETPRPLQRDHPTAVPTGPSSTLRSGTLGCGVRVWLGCCHPDFLAPAERGRIGPDPKEDQREFAGHRDRRFPEAFAGGEPDTPTLQGREALDPRQKRYGRLVEAGAQHGITGFGDATRVVDLTGLVAPRRQTDVGGDTVAFLKRSG